MLDILHVAVLLLFFAREMSSVKLFLLEKYRRAEYVGCFLAVLVAVVSNHSLTVLLSSFFVRSVSDC